jgi:undecaprenyl-diphosphatase
MINNLNAILFGLIQGITEFLPISSSGHLLILHRFLLLPVKNELAFDVALHFSTFLATVLFFKKDIWELMKSWVMTLSGQISETGKISWLIMLATVPAALAGYFFNNLIETSFRSPLIVVIMLIVVGILFIILEKISKKTENLNSLTWRKALFIGLAQAIALIPGTSRSGITIIAGLASGLKREAAVRFSFLLLAPITLGAAIKEAPQSFLNLTSNDWIFLIIAFLAAFISALLAIRFFLLFAKNNKLNIFAYYRFALAGLILLNIIF